MRYLPRNYDNVTADAMRFAESAAMNGWLFNEYIQSARDAWIIQHENALSQAKYSIEQDIKKSQNRTEL